MRVVRAGDGLCEAGAEAKGEARGEVRPWPPLMRGVAGEGIVEAVRVETAPAAV